MPTFTNEMIEAAIGGLEAKKQSIDAQIAELRAMLTGGAVSHGARGGKRKFGPEAIRRMREAQRLRWARARGEEEAAPHSKPKRKISAAGRKAISEAAKKRWALKKADGGSKSAGRKKTAAKKA